MKLIGERSWLLVGFRFIAYQHVGRRAVLLRL
jgi:hypothetical protein